MTAEPVNAELTSDRRLQAVRPIHRKPRREPVETPQFAAMMSRLITAYGLRVADADPEDLVGLVDLHRQLDEAITTAVAGLHRRHSWAEIARVLGISRQAACKRWGSLDEQQAEGSAEESMEAS